MTPHKNHMREAIQLAKEGMRTGTGGPFGAVIVKDDKIIGRGQNCVTSTNDPTAHAEVSAIRQACKTLSTFSLEDCEIYTSCEPCPMCLSAIYWARLGKIYYAATQNDAEKIDFIDAFIYEELEKPASERMIPTQQLLQPEAVEVFDEWAKLEDKIHY